MTIKNTFILTGCSLSICLAVVGCGGSNTSTVDEGTTSSSKSTYTVSGTVPGTLNRSFL